MVTMKCLSCYFLTIVFSDSIYSKGNFVSKTFLVLRGSEEADREQ